MRKRAILVSILFLAAAIAARADSGKQKPCSVHPKKGAKKSDLAAMARVTPEEARKTALASLGAGVKAEAKEGEIEAEKGCLVYSFDIKIAGKSGVEG